MTEQKLEKKLWDDVNEAYNLKDESVLFILKNMIKEIEAK